MKHIIKNVEPTELLNWKQNDKMFQRGKPNWNRLKKLQKDALLKSTFNEQGGICCYCERYLQFEDCHLEHFKSQEDYEEEQLNYQNILCSCQRKLSKGEPRHCGNSKGSHDYAKFISPFDENCEGYFSYTAEGEILPALNNNKVNFTIEKLQLNIEKLIKSRQKVIEPFLDEELSDDEFILMVTDYLIEKEDNNGYYNEFYTTIKYLFGAVITS